MAYLDWRESSVRCVVGAHHCGRTALTMEVQRDLGFQLACSLNQLFSAQEGQGVALELRLDLPGSWTLFMKHRCEGSRFLLARPEPGKWVATLAFEETLARSLIEFLRKGDPSQDFIPSERGSIWEWSNLEWVLRIFG